MTRQITENGIKSYRAFLLSEERCKGTIEKYLRDLNAFAAWMRDREVSRENAVGWKEELLQKGYAPATVNSMISAVNGFFRFQGWEDCRIRFLRIQRRMFRDQEKDLSREEYNRLVKAASDLGKTQLTLLMETICSTGIRVSEVRYITVEAIKKGRADISLKGKIRTILLPGKLCRKLLKYIKRHKIATGAVFLNSKRQDLSRRQIWKEMKGLCQQADVEATKVFPHNLRHLFATVFYRCCRDIVKLADVLGHSCIETTRIYLLSTGKEHAKQLDRLGLVT